MITDMSILKSKNIIWPLVIMYFLQSYLLSDELFFTLAGVVLAYMVAKNHFKLTVPKIPGLMFYLMLLVFITIVGLIRYPIRFVARDVFYQFNNILLIFIGYLIYWKEKDDTKIYTTVFLMLGLVSFITLISALINIGSGSVSFTTFRESFATGIKSLECFFPIFTIWIFVYKKTVLSKRIDRMIIIFWLIQIICNLSRTTLLAVFTCYFVTVVLLKITRKMNAIKFKRVISLIVTGGFFFLIIINILPDTAILHFMDKIANSFSEINSNEVFSSLAEANTNWRGYEISRAVEQWSQASFVAQIFGSGNGTLVGISFVPDHWQDIVQTLNGISGVTVLHNSFYTLLIKGGVITVISFCMIFILGIKKGYRHLKIAAFDHEVLLSLSLIILCCTMIIDAYVTRGMVQNDAQFAWAILFGWLNARMVDVSRVKSYE